MAATTPKGSRYVLVSMSLATSNTSPFRNSGAPQAASATCSPRRTSPLASAKVLPCSSVMLAARRSQCSRTRPTNLNMICWRASTLVFRHAGKAFWALSTAAWSSASVDCGTLVTRLLVAGSWSSIHLSACEALNSLSMNHGVSCGWAIRSWFWGKLAAVDARALYGRRCWAVAARRREAVAREAMVVGSGDAIKATGEGRRDAARLALTTMPREEDKRYIVETRTEQKERARSTLR